ncbi:unnamed protein product [Phytophthora lilii]|uniref:Unnamed protein product n=1 Tax=Phytophthora lilii TaxID=2077276 RepID=A0A9W6U5Q2_9STRA|nr:unnamed protein product [Phytophthora lilii]
MMSVLMTHYSSYGLSRMLISAKNADNLENIATKLQTELIRAWLRKREYVDSVYEYIGLRTKLSMELFNDPQFSLWDKYAQFDRNSIKAISVMVATLKIDKFEVNALSRASPFSDLATGMGLFRIGSTVVNLLMKYSTNSFLKTQEIGSSEMPTLAFGPIKETKAFVARLQAKQLRVWRDNRVPANDVFEYLGLYTVANMAENALFESPQFKAWSKYVRQLNKNDPKKTTSMMLSTLTYAVGDTTAARIIIAAKDAEKSKRLATELQNAQLEAWLLAKKKPGWVHSYLDVRAAETDSPTRLRYHQYRKDFNSRYGTTYYRSTREKATDEYCSAIVSFS